VYYILGDININLLNATNDSIIQQYVDTYAIVVASQLKIKSHVLTIYIQIICLLE